MAKVIQVSQIKNTFSPPERSVYDRQKAKVELHRQQMEKQRREQEEERERKELMEATFAPRTNGQAVNQDFFTRQTVFQTQFNEKMRVLREIERKKETEFTFKPTLNPTSLYIVENRKQVQNEQIHEEMKKTKQFQPQIDDYAKQLQFSQDVFDRLTTTKGSYKSSSQKRSEELTKKPDKMYNTLGEEINFETQELQMQRLVNYHKIYEGKKKLELMRSTRQVQKVASPDDVTKQRTAELLQRKMVREMNNEQRKKVIEVEEIPTFQPQINKTSKLLCGDKQPFEERLAEQEKEKTRKLEQLRVIQQNKELEPCTFHPQLDSSGPVTIDDFLEKQEAHMRRKLALENELKEKKIKNQQQEEKYVLDHCTGFKAKEVPSFGPLLFSLDQNQKKQVGELLENGDINVQKQLKNVGGGDVVVGGLVVDSVSKFVKRIKQGKEEAEYKKKQLMM